MKFGVIGYGYWGPNVVRNLTMLDGSEIVAIADMSPKSQARARKSYPSIKVIADPKEIIESTEIDVVAIITPVWTHYELAKAALENGKHVFVEKPFTSNSEQGQELIEIAERKGLQIMVDHTFLFTGAVRKIAQLVDQGELGKIFYYDSTRVNLGLFQHDVNVVWDLAPHDLAIMDYLFKTPPEAVVATGQNHLNGKEDIAFMTLYYPNRAIAHVNVNWLSPVKIRTTLIGGEKKMVVWNDLEADEKVRVYDRGAYIDNQEGVYNLLVSYRSGDMYVPKLEQVEALTLELSYFVECINGNKVPINDGHAGLRVVKMLEAASQSIKQRGSLVTL